MYFILIANGLGNFVNIQFALELKCRKTGCDITNISTNNKRKINSVVSRMDLILNY